MGDRCYSVLQCNNKHIKIFIKVGYSLTSCPSAACNVSSVEMTDEEANYGNYEELGQLEGKGIPFYGWNGLGSEYSACAFASDGRNLDFAACDETGNLTVRFDKKTFQVNEKDVEECKKYLKVFEQAKFYIDNDLDELAVLGSPVPTKHDKLVSEYKKRKRNAKIK